MVMQKLLLSSVLAAVVVADNVVIEDFSSSATHTWEETNDPVMGGRSTGTFTVEEGYAHFEGTVAIVPFLKAPGFIKAETNSHNNWPDISSCDGLELTVSSRTNYDGFRISFGKNHPEDAMRYAYGYKADMKLAAAAGSSSKETVRIPFTDFTDKWDAGTGNAITTCREDEQFCPDQETLHKNGLYSIAIWGEGVEGDVDLDLYGIEAYGCDSSSSNNNNDDNSTDSSNDDNEDNQKDNNTSNDSVETPESTEETVTTAQQSENNNNDEILLEDFADPINEWRSMNDPVMGGRSTGSVIIEDGVAKFDGECAIVPKLNAPGFVKMVTGGGRGGGSQATFPDVSSCRGIKVVMRSGKDKDVDDYTGYRIGFGTHHEADGRYATGYKAPAFSVPTADFGEMEFPFESFSAKWDDATGDITTPCSYQNPELCPDVPTLRSLKTMSFWGEGVAGTVALEIKTISAVGCNGDGAATKGEDIRERSYNDNTTTNPLFAYNNRIIVGGFVVASVLIIGIVYGTKFQNREHTTASFNGSNNDGDDGELFNIT